MSGQEELIAKLIDVVAELTKEVNAMKSEIANFSGEFKEFREEKQKALEFAEKRAKDLNDLQEMGFKFNQKVYDEYVVQLLDVPFQDGDKDIARDCWERLWMEYIEEQVGQLDEQQKKEVQESAVFQRWRVSVANMHSDKKGIIHREAVVPFLVNKNWDSEVVQKISEGDLTGNEELITELYDHIWQSITFLKKAIKPDISAGSAQFVLARVQTWAGEETQSRTNQYNQANPVFLDDSEGEGNDDVDQMLVEEFEEETSEYRTKLLGHQVYQDSLPKTAPKVPVPVLKKTSNPALKRVSNPALKRASNPALKKAPPKTNKKTSYKKIQKETPSADKLQLAQTLRATKRYSEEQIINMIQASEN